MTGGWRKIVCPVLSSVWAALSGSIERGPTLPYWSPMAHLVTRSRINPETGKKAQYYLIEWKEGRKSCASAIGFVSQKQAEKALKIWEGRVAGGETPQQLTGKSSGSTLIDALADLAVHRKAKGLSAATLELDRYATKAILEHLGENRPLAEIRGTVLDRYVLARREDGVRARTIQIELTHLRRALELAVEAETLAKCPKMPTLRADTKGHRWLTPAQQDALMAALPWDTAPGSAAAIWLALELGLRIGEALSRRWEHVSWDQRVLTIDAESAKTRTMRVLPLAAPVLARLRELYLQAGRADDALICQGVCYVRSALKAACKRAKLDYVHPHGLRHSWATRLALAGVDRPTLMALGGWTSGEMLDEVYAHAHPAHLREQVERTALR